MIDLRPDPPPLGSPGDRFAGDLGGGGEPVPPSAVAPHVVADDLFGMTFRVEVCGIDEIAAELDKAVDDLFRLLDARAPAEVFTEGHRAETERAHTQPSTAEGNIVIEGHGALRVGIWYNSALVP